MKKHSKMLVVLGALLAILVVVFFALWQEEKKNTNVVKEFLKTYYTVKDGRRYEELLADIGTAAKEGDSEKEIIRVAKKAYEQYVDCYGEFFTEDAFERFIISREITGIERLSYDERSRIAPKSINVSIKTANKTSRFIAYSVTVTYTLSDAVGTRVKTDEWRIDTRIIDGKELISSFRIV